MSDRTVDWSMAPADAYGWRRENGTCWWLASPSAGAVQGVRLGGAPDLVPWDTRETVSLVKGMQP